MGLGTRISIAESRIKRLRDELDALNSEISRKKKDLRAEEKDLEEEIRHNEEIRNYKGKNDKKIELLKQEVVCEEHIAELCQKIIEKAESFPDPNRTMPYFSVERMYEWIESSNTNKQYLLDRIEGEEKDQSDERNLPRIERSDETVSSARTSFESSKKALEASIKYRDSVADRLEGAKQELESLLAERDRKKM